MKLEDVVVRFDGYTVRVYMGKHMTEKQCGLCGHFDEEVHFTLVSAADAKLFNTFQRDNEFLTANKEYTDDIMEFHESYLLKDRVGV